MSYKPKDPYKFEELVKKYIEDDGRTQASTARILGYSRDTFNKWIRGENQIPFDVIHKLCELWDLTSLEKHQLYSLAGYQFDLSTEDRQLQRALKERMDLKILGEAVYKAEALYSEKKLPDKLEELLDNAREWYDHERKRMGEETTMMRFGDLEARKVARDRIEERLAKGERFIYDATIDVLRPSHEMLEEANIRFRQKSEDVAQAEIEAVNKLLPHGTLHAIARLQRVLVEPLFEEHRRIIIQKMDELRNSLWSKIHGNIIHKFVYEKLTTQEVEIAKALSNNDWSPNRVAVEFGLHTTTVNIRLNHIYTKLEAYFGLKEADLSTLTIILKDYWEMNPDQ